MAELYDEVKKRIEKGESLSEIKEKLIEQGFIESKIIETISEYNSKEWESKSGYLKKAFAKEMLDKISYGFTSLQFINILFFSLGAAYSYFIIGLANGFKVVLSAITQSFIQKQPVKYINRRIIGINGILFGLTFLIIAAAGYYGSLLLFAASFLIAGVSVVFYGGYYQEVILGAKRGSRLMNILARYGLIITAVSLVFAAYLMDKFSYGYLIIFSTAAVAFIISGLLLIFTNDVKSEKGKGGFWVSMGSAFSLNIIMENKGILKNKTAAILLIAGLVTSIVQTIGNSYYGIIIYTKFGATGFGGFLNVAMVFLIAVFSSLIGAIVTRINVREYGKFPLLVFGTLLLALMPLSYYYKPTLVTITMGTMFGIIGGAIIGFTQGLLALDLNKESRISYFSVSNVAMVFAYIIFVPLMAFIAQYYSIESLLLVLVAMLAAVIPLYLSVLLRNKKILKNEFSLVQKHEKIS